MPRLDALFAPPAPLGTDDVAAIREILDELGVRALLEEEIASHRARALHLLRGVTAVSEPASIALVEQLVASATGATEARTAAA